jgi:periplasmic divalent cation tolerance protein
VADTAYYQVSTTIDSGTAAQTLAKTAVEARVAACAQVVGPIHSTYWWEGQVQQGEREWLILFKTAADQAEALQAHLLEHHSYDVPEVIVTPLVGGNPAYLRWIDQETKGGAGSG